MTPWKEGATWLVIDTETTGLDPKDARLVELGAVEYRDGIMGRKMGQLLNPEIPIPEGASKIHGITDADVADKPTLRDIAKPFLRHVYAADVLVGYNWPFDERFLAAGLGTDWTATISTKPVLDPLVLVRLDDVGRYWKGKGRHKLANVAKRLKVEFRGQAHRATADCIMAARILWRLRSHLPDDAHEAAAMLGQQRRKQDDDFSAYRKRKGGRRG